MNSQSEFKYHLNIELAKVESNIDFITNQLNSEQTSQVQKEALKDAINVLLEMKANLQKINSLKVTFNTQEQ